MPPQFWGLFPDLGGEWRGWSPNREPTPTVSPPPEFWGVPEPPLRFGGDPELLGGFWGEGGEGSGRVGGDNLPSIKGER